MRRDWLIRINMKEWAVKGRIAVSEKDAVSGRYLAGIDVQSTEVSMHE